MAKRHTASGFDVLLDEFITDPSIQNNNTAGSLKQYKLGRWLGRGTSCVCVEITSCDSNRVYCAKVIPKSWMVKGRNTQAVISEIRQHRKLHHPYIVKLERFFEDSNYVYILLEKCTCSFMQLLRKRKRFSEHSTSKYISHLVDALLYLEQQGFYHGDLKLGNFLFKDNRLLLSDFGFIKCLKDSHAGILIGTPNYMAPESLALNKTQFSDLWAIGVCIFTMLTGTHPFETDTVSETYSKIKKVDYTFPDNIPLSEHAVDVVTKLLSSTPTDRPNLTALAEHPFLKLHQRVDPTSKSGCSSQAQYHKTHRAGIDTVNQCKQGQAQTISSNSSSMPIQIGAPDQRDQTKDCRKGGNGHDPYSLAPTPVFTATAV